MTDLWRHSTLAHLDAKINWYSPAAALKCHDMDWLTAQLQNDASLTIRSLTNDHTILMLAGPKSRAVLAAASRGDRSASAFPRLSVRRACIRITPAVVMSASFSGELACVFHVPNVQLCAAYLALRKAAGAHGLRLFGAHTVVAMQLEKAIGIGNADLVTEFTAQESRLVRFVKMDKPTFIGKAALAKSTPKKIFVSLTLDCAHDPVHGGDSIMEKGRVVGTVTSFSWGHRVGSNIAMGLLDPAHAVVGTALHVEVIGAPVPATVVQECLYDRENVQVRV
jgi:dimethylglycine dehydrogenase